MTKTTNKKKMHHVVPHFYLDAWRMPKVIFAYNLLRKESFEGTGRNTFGAIGKFYNFSFDGTVISLLRYTFEERILQASSGGIDELMLAVFEFMKNYEYEHKTENFLEDFYEKIETKISAAMDSVFRRELQLIQRNPEAFDYLIIFYCIQLMRTPKARKAVATDMYEIWADDIKLNEQQKDEYLKVRLLIDSLAMAADILNKGCTIRIGYARLGEKFVTSDAPVLGNSRHIERIEDYSGVVPISPRLLMEVDNIGLGQRIQSYYDIDNAKVEHINLRLISNATMNVFFSSRNHRDKYLDAMEARRH